MYDDAMYITVSTYIQVHVASYILVYNYLFVWTAINGRVYGNIGGFDMCVGDKVSWHMIGFGERFDSHAAIFEGNNVLHDSRMVHFVSVLPGISQTAYMNPDNPGRFICMENL